MVKCRVILAECMYMGTENRRHERIDLATQELELVLNVLNDAGTTLERRVRPHDLSRSGMAFTDARPLKENTRCIMLITHQGAALRVIGKITHARPLDDGRHLMGMRFTTISMVPASMPGLVLTNNPAVGQLLINT